MNLATEEAFVLDGGVVISIPHQVQDDGLELKTRCFLGGVAGVRLVQLQEERCQDLWWRTRVHHRFRHGILSMSEYLKQLQ